MSDSPILALHLKLLEGLHLDKGEASDHDIRQNATDCRQANGGKFQGRHGLIKGIKGQWAGNSRAAGLWVGSSIRSGGERPSAGDGSKRTGMLRVSDFRDA